MNEKRVSPNFISCLRACFLLLHPKAQVNAVEIPFISPRIRIASVAVFAISFYAAITLITRLHAIDATDLRYLPMIALWDIYGVFCVFVLVYALEAAMLRFRAMVVRCLLRRKDVAFSQLQPLMIPYGFLIWLAHTAIVLATIFSGSNWLGYFLLLLLQLPVTAAVVRPVQATFRIDHHGAVRLGVAYFLTMHIGTVLFYLGLNRLFFLLS